MIEVKKYNYLNTKKIETKSIYDYHDLCFDWEILPNFWCVSFLEFNKNTNQIIEKITFQSDPNNSQNTYLEIFKLKQYILDKTDNCIFIAWNVNYDKHILFEFLKQIKHLENQLILPNQFNQQNFNNSLFTKSTAIVNNDDEYSFLNWDFEIIFYDAMKYMVNPKSLKTSGGESGFSMLESSIPWNQENLNQAEIDEIIFYNKHDVDVLFRLLLKYYDAYEIRKELVNEFSPDKKQYLEYKNNAFFNQIYKLTKKDKQSFPKYFNFYDEINNRDDLIKIRNIIYKIENTPNLEPQIKLILDKLKVDKIPTNEEKYEIIFDDQKGHYGKLFGMDVIFALGGIHGSSKMILNRKAVMKDVASYYPNGFINYNLQPRVIKQEDKNILKELMEKRLIFKHSSNPALKKKDKAYKVIINANYGLSRSQIANIQDAINGTILCILGQILLLYLCNKIKDYVLSFIQINTDGIYYVPKHGQDEIIDKLCNDWQKETDFVLETDISTKTFNFNVNNYVLEFDNGKIKAKGRYLNQYSNDLLNKSAMELVYDNTIIGKMLINLVLYQKSFDDTINENQELWKYASVKKITSNYDYLIDIKDKYMFNASSILKDKVLNKPFIELEHYDILKQKTSRFFAVKNGKQYRKYALKKTFDNSLNSQSEDKIIEVLNNEVVAILKPKKDNSYSISYKIYQGEKIAGISTSSLIYNKPLFNNYENNYDLKKEDIKTITDFKKETGYDLDFDWYKQQVINLIKAYDCQTELKQIIYNYDDLIK